MNAIPRFPETKPLELSDKLVVDEFFRKYPPQISEFTFTNLFAWRQAYHFSLSSIDEGLLIVSEKNQELRIFDPLCPAASKRTVVESVIAGLNKKIRFVRIPEATVDLLKGLKNLKIEEDRDNFDYLYETGDLIELKGVKFDGKRNFIKRFKTENNFIYKAITEENTRQCLEFEEEWCLAKDCQRIEGLLCEKEAFKEMLENFKALGISGGMILIDGKVEAVTMGEALNPETFVIHMEKGNGRFAGIYQAINQLFLETEAGGFPCVNREQDLGVLGLRQSKESYHPSSMVKKYTVSF